MSNYESKIEKEYNVTFRKARADREGDCYNFNEKVNIGDLLNCWGNDTSTKDIYQKVKDLSYMWDEYNKGDWEGDWDEPFDDFDEPKKPEEDEKEYEPPIDFKNPFTNRWITCDSEEEKSLLEHLFEIEKQIYALLIDLAKDGKTDSADVQKCREEMKKTLSDMDDLDSTYPAKFKPNQRKREAKVIKKRRALIVEYETKKKVEKDRAIYEKAAPNDPNAWDRKVHALDDLFD